MRLFTIGFTKKSAEQFFSLLANSGARTLVDVRLNNVSQLAGFTKRDDLAYFLRSIPDMGYRHDLRLAPTQPMLDRYKKDRVPWAVYEAEFLDLVRSRGIADALYPEDMDEVVLLCSEAEPHHCHRRLVAEHLASQWHDVEIIHL
jgi:uncharacterized protein (DUF488 family)